MKFTQLNVEQCHAGAMLAEDIISEGGIVILKAGAELSEDRLKSLSNNGVKAISIVCEEKLSAEELEKRRHKIAKKMNKLFRRSDDDSYLAQMKEMLVEYYVSRG
ncbi:MAG: hypothetical protein OEX07_10925 [Gammaproteobacteria bacterium]|nr:hypothetical protein [Gammaproteobacteria bacterium]